MTSILDLDYCAHKKYAQSLALVLFESGQMSLNVRREKSLYQTSPFLCHSLSQLFTLNIIMKPTVPSSITRLTRVD